MAQKYFITEVPSTAHILGPQPGVTYGVVLVWAKITDIIIAPDAADGEHIFDQIITVSYTAF